MGAGLLTTTTQLPLVLFDKHGEPFTVRQMEPADRPVLHEMYLDFQPKRAAQGLPPENEYGLKRWLDHVLKGGEHLLVEVNDVVKGHLMLIPMEDGRSIELAIYLHQSIRGRGIGTAMNKVAVNLARIAGYARVWLSVEITNVAAIRSYQKAGFKRTAATLWAHEIEMEVVFD
ncbi:MAG TPA: GNAT family N-acetyltransferase [Longimicrobiales bacterium]